MVAWSKSDVFVTVHATFAGPHGGSIGEQYITFSVAIAGKDWARSRVDFDKLQRQAARFWLVKHAPEYCARQDRIAIRHGQIDAAARLEYHGPDIVPPPVPEILQIRAYDGSAEGCKMVRMYETADAYQKPARVGVRQYKAALARLVDMARDAGLDVGDFEALAA